MNVTPLARPIVVRTLTDESRGLYAEHLRRLSAADRQLRFGLPMLDRAIDTYVDGIDLGRDAILAVTFDDAVPLGAAHLARGQGFAELAVSVLEGYRGRGIGSAMFAKGLEICGEWHVYELFTHCFVRNRPMMQLARKHGMRIVIEGAEADAYRAVEPVAA